MFKGKTNFKSTELRYLNIRDYQVGMHTNGADGMLPKNSLSYIENMDYSETGGLMSRQRLVQYPGIYSSDGVNDVYPIVNVGQLGSNYIMLKGINFYYVSTNSVGIWHRILTSTRGAILNFTINENNSHKFVNFNTINPIAIINLNFSAYNQRYITVTNTLQINIYVGKYIKIGTEYRYITSNTANIIYINGMFDNSYTAGPVAIYDKLPCLVFIETFNSGDMVIYGNSPGFGFKSILGFVAGDIYKDRLFYISATGSTTSRLHFSEIGIVDYTPNNNFIDVEGSIKTIKRLGNRLVIYTDKDVIYLYGSSPNDFRIEYQLTSNTLLYRNSVTNGNNVQFYMSDLGLQSMLYIDNKVIANSLSISNNIQDIIRDYISTTGIPQDMVVFGNKVYIGIGFKVIVYDIAKSQRFKTNLFSVYDFADANIASLDVLTDYKPTFITVLQNRVVFGINGTTHSFDEYSKTNKGYYYPNGIDGNPMTVISNKIDFQSGFRDKIFRRLKFYLTSGRLNNVSSTVVYQIKIYIKFDDGIFNLVKTTNNLNDEVFVSGKFKNLIYKIEIMPTSGGVAYMPIEITNLSIGYSLLSKM